MPRPVSLVWFRLDLRLQDNPALAAALARGAAVVPVYILDDAGEGAWVPGGASRSWLHHSLAALDATLRARGLRLVLARGDSLTELERLRRVTGADAIFWNRRYEPAIRARDARIKETLRASGLTVESSNAALLHEPHQVQNKSGNPFQVFTPFWRHCLERPVAEPVGGPPHLPAAEPWPAPADWPESLPLADLGLTPRLGWDRGFYAVWTPGEAGARTRLQNFVTTAMTDYGEQRDRPDVAGTSQLSPHLHFGEVGPRQIWAAVRASARGSGVFPPSGGAGKFLSEVGWREFAFHLLYHFPHTPEQPLRAEFARFPWAEDAAGETLRRWQRGQTGYPIVDAGMRQLWTTGWMHNRVRMVVASFLVKHLRLPWQQGAAWFWDTLVDADLAANTLGWQWTAGCGADAAPYFRVFNPMTQGEKFDVDGAYVRQWVPELARLPQEHLNAPWAAPAAILQRAGVQLGESYPRPIVNHATARESALAAFAQLKMERG